MAMREHETGPRAPRPYHHGDLREALTQAGFLLLAERGLTGFSVAEVARRVGVSTAAPYRHFADRDDMIRAIAVRAARELATEMRAAVEEAGPDPVEQFAATAGVYVRYVGRRGTGFNVIFASALERFRDRDLAEAGRELIDLLLGLARALGKGAAESVVVMEQHIALAHGYVTLFRDDFFIRRGNSLEDIAELAVDGSRRLVGSTR